MSQAEVAERSGVPQHQISRLEKGIIERPSMEELVKLAAVYGVEPNEVARLAGWWKPSPRYVSEDPRWVYTQNYLAKTDEADREKLLEEIYDRVLFHETIIRLMAEKAENEAQQGAESASG